jgi:hypothetical protein
MGLGSTGASRGDGNQSKSMSMSMNGGLVGTRWCGSLPLRLLLLLVLLLVLCIPLGVLARDNPPFPLPPAAAWPERGTGCHAKTQRRQEDRTTAPTDSQNGELNGTGAAPSTQSRGGGQAALA